MDGLSAAASVIAVIQISAQVFDLCRTYYLNVKDARKDIQRLRNEVNSLQDILVNVADLAHAAQPSSLRTLSIVNQKDGPLEQCRVELTALLAKLDPGEGASKLALALRSLKWPLHSKEVDQVLLAIGRYKSSFILALSTDQASLSLAISQDVSDIKNHLEAQKTDKERELIIRWLSTTDPSVNFDASCRKCQPETGQWLINRAEFKDWRASPNSFLWLYGIPGCGKTILSSTIIRHLQQFSDLQPNYAVAYFYFDFNSIAKQEVIACVSSLVAQLCTRLTTFPAHTSQLYDRCNQGSLRPGLDELTAILCEVIQSLDHAFIIIDALDECPKGEGRASLLTVLSKVKSMSLHNLHTIVTSRREPDIENNLCPLLTSQPISLEGSGVEWDIKSHISSVLATDPKLRKWFRWVFCQLEALKRCLKISLVRKALRDLPKTLDDTYSRLFLDIDEEYREEARSALLWLAFSNRPLLLTELAEAIVVRPLADPPFDPEERFPDPESVLQILSSLVSISRNSGGEDTLVTVTMAHFSVKEYLISDRIRTSPAQYFTISYPAGLYFIAECCLLYVLHYASLKAEKGSIASREDLETFPLLMYASNGWFEHINMLPLDDQKRLTPLVLGLLLSGDALPSWRYTHLLTSSIGSVSNFPPPVLRTADPLYWASSLGLFDAVKELLALGIDPNGLARQPSLHKAITKGHDNVAILLLNHGANANGKDHLGYSPLHHAAEIGNLSMVQELFMFEAQASPRDNLGVTPLHLAALHSHERVAEFLIARGAEVEVATIDHLQTPFHWAAWYESKKLVVLFLKHGANINAQNYDGETALHYAARENQMILQDLLDNGADLEVETHCGETPLYWAAKGEHRGPIEKLVKAGAKITPPLLSFAKDEFLPMYRSKFHLLLEVGMSANEETASLTLLALQECARMGYALCDECRRILSELSGGRTIHQILPIRNKEETSRHWPFKVRLDHPLLSCSKEHERYIT
ncbi:hypothetical protein N431DRAFT_376754 [Stipitochalara longipes BDJ]|nr:hypothetical protein N431DRAFT_376754 [Stipitochalara longipes BDJ]